MSSTKITSLLIDRVNEFIQKSIKLEDSACHDYSLIIVVPNQYDMDLNSSIVIFKEGFPNEIYGSVKIKETNIRFMVLPITSYFDDYCFTEHKILRTSNRYEFLRDRIPNSYVKKEKNK